MENEDFVEIEELFLTILKTVDLMLESDFYIEKKAILNMKEDIKNWYDDYKVKDSLLGIQVEKLKSLDLEITELFSKYIETESVSNNYSEILSYDFGRLKRYWKDEFEKGRSENV